MRSVFCLILVYRLTICQKRAFPSNRCMAIEAKSSSSLDVEYLFRNPSSCNDASNRFPGPFSFMNSELPFPYLNELGFALSHDALSNELRKSLRSVCENSWWNVISTEASG